MAYIVQADIESVFGRRNVAMWSQPDNSTTPDIANTARVAAAIAYAEAYFDDRMRGFIYTVPLSATPLIVKDALARLAGAWLYEGRGMGDEDSEEENPYRVGAERTINRILRGEIRLNVALAGDHPTVPVLVTNASDEEWPWLP